MVERGAGHARLLFSLSARTIVRSYGGHCVCNLPEKARPRAERCARSACASSVRRARCARGNISPRCLPTGVFTLAAVERPKAASVIVKEKHGASTERAEPSDWAVNAAAGILDLLPDRRYMRASTPLSLTDRSSSWKSNGLNRSSFSAITPRPQKRSHALF